MKLIFATGNKGKLHEASAICEMFGEKYGIQLEVELMPDKVDIPENGTTYKENALIKAKYVWDKYHCPCFADDSGLEVEALGGGPGLYTARYCDHNFADGIEKLLFELKRLGAETPEQRRCAFECWIALIVDGEPYFFEGRCPGRVSTKRCGTTGFGYDPVFMPDAAGGLCMAELEDGGKNLISHRGKAMEKMCRFLSDNFNNDSSVDKLTTSSTN